MKRLAILLAGVSLASSVQAASVIPLTIVSGQIERLQSSDALWNGTNPFGLMSGSFTSGHCLQSGGSSLIVDSGGTCGGGGGTGTVTSLIAGTCLTGGTITTTGTIALSGSCEPTAANPTASLGLSVINGSASTFMRSDAAPALDQTIAPTWTGKHTFSSGGVFTPEATPATNEIGYLGFPVASQTTNFTIALSECGKLESVNDASAWTGTIDKNANKNYPVGCTVGFYGVGAGTGTITPTSPATLLVPGSGTSASLTVPQYGLLKIVQVATDVWLADVASGCQLVAPPVTTTGSQSSVAFSSIPQNYQTLQLRVNAANSSGSGGNVQLQFNGDTGGNYDTQGMIAANTTAQGFGQQVGTTSAFIGQISGPTGPTNGAQGITATIYNYSGTTFQKSITSNDGQRNAASSGTMYSMYFAAWWRNTAAINSMLVTLSSGHFVDGSTLYLSACPF